MPAASTGQAGLAAEYFRRHRGQLDAARDRHVVWPVPGTDEVFRAEMDANANGAGLLPIGGM